MSASLPSQNETSFPSLNKYLFLGSFTFSMQIEPSLATFSFKLPVVFKIYVSLYPLSFFGTLLKVYALRFGAIQR